MIPIDTWAVVAIADDTITVECPFIERENATIGLFTIGNTPGVELPSTGGSGTLTYTLTGIFLITLAGVLLVSRKRKANR